MTAARAATARRRMPYPAVLATLGAALLLAATAGLALGSVRIPPGEVWAIALHGAGLSWFEPDWSAPRETIVLRVRVPRVLLGAVVGAGLAVLGVAMQTLVRNPLADPYLLGVSSGASLGAVAVIVSGVTLAGSYSLPLAAFAGALLSLFLVYATARSAGQLTALRLVLAGVAVGAVLSALTSFLLITTANGNQAREVLAWTLGGLGGASWETLWLPAAVLLGAVAVLLARARPLNLLLAGEEAATTMGLEVGRFRVRMFVLLSVVTGVVVAASGPIGFVGLMLPHAVRLLVGGDHRRVLPAAALAGAVFLVLADLAARTVAAPRELPVGVLTALCGGPFFLWLLRRHTGAGAERGPR